MSINFYIVYGHFHAILAELNSCGKTVWPAKQDIFINWPFEAGLGVG